jgi:cytochrome c oxidase cbb3-type subunit 3
MSKLTKIKALALTMLFPLLGICQNDANAHTTYFSNALFNTLFGVILLLLIIIVAFSGVLKNVADSDYLDKKLKKENEASSTGRIVSTLFFIFFSFSLMAQDGKDADNWLIGGLDQFTFYFMMTIIFVELLVLGLLIYQFKFLIRTKTTLVAEKARVASPLMASLTDAVAVEEEESIMLDHDYDGIRELDNNLPPWWKYGFYLTIVIAFVYLINYHVTGSGDLQGKEYEKEMAQAKLEVEEFMKNSANNVDESTVKLLTEKTDLDAGKDVYLANCAACHGKLGEGTVGPNFADEYWIHGGSIQDIFKTIKYGWVEKGMKAWKEDLSPMQIAQVTSFIKLLKGTNPPNGKAPQGDLYSETAAAPANDSTHVANDSLAIQIKADSLSTTKK